MEIAAIVLDAVGTLIHPEPPVAIAYARAAAEQGIDLDRAVIRDRFHDCFHYDSLDAGLGAYSTDEATEQRRWRRIVANVLPEVPDLERAFSSLWEHFARPESWRLDPKDAEAVRTCRAMGFQIRVASNFDARLRRVLKGFPELEHQHEEILISSEIGVRKPHPGFYEAVGSHVGLSHDRVLFVGDDRENDFLAPRRAGFPALLLTESDTEVHEAERLGRLSDLPIRLRMCETPTKIRSANRRVDEHAAGS